MVIRTHHIPMPGETVMGSHFMMNPGGKGANQAVAIARLGGDITFVCKTGKDIFGRQAQARFAKEGIHTQYIFEDEEFTSGVALVTVDDRGENCITVAPGANMRLNVADLEKVHPAIDGADIVLMQLEIPVETVEYAAKLAGGRGKRVILNPAPAQNLSPGLLRSLYLVTPNETEAEMISGQKVVDLDTARKAAEIIKEKGVKNVVITMGSKGSFVYTDELCELIPACQVQAVDTTAAGDIFNGALTVALSEGKSLLDAIQFGNVTSAISVTRAGAQASAPTRKEVEAFIISVSN